MVIKNITITYSAGSMTRKGLIVFQKIPLAVMPISKSKKIISDNIPTANKRATKNCFNRFTYIPDYTYVCIRRIPYAERFMVKMDITDDVG